MTKLLSVTTLAFIALAGCKDEVAAIPDPARSIPDDALGHYCQMLVADHAGPKAQIFLKGEAAPIWFAQVADARAYLSDPERDGEIAAVYVTDMGRVESWEVPGPDAWIAATEASYVIESTQMGGMGVPEAVPFGSRDAAEAFMAGAGGQLVSWDEIPEAYVHPDMAMMMDGMAMDAMAMDGASMNGAGMVDQK